MDVRTDDIDDPNGEENYIKGGTRLPYFIRPNTNAETELFKYAQNEFVHSVITTISAFEQSLAQPRNPNDAKSGYCVLVLPSMSRWAVFITKAVLRELFTSLTAVKIGASNQLRLIVCHEDVLQRKIMKDILAMNTLSVGKQESVDSPQNEQINIRNHLNEVANSNPELESPQSQSQFLIDAKLVGSKILDDPLPKNEEILKNYQPDADCVWSGLSAAHYSDILQAMGPVWIMKPDWSRLEDVPDICPDFKSGEMDHALEFYDFPSTFVDNDICEIFQEFKTAGFNVYWSDDTHGIVRFSSKEVADLALESIQHPLLKCRPISSASRQTKLMLVRSAERRLPFKRRPATESDTAKRLILSSLGILKNPRNPNPKLSNQTNKSS